MPVFKIDLQFRYETEYWTNKYYVIATDIADAEEFVNGVVAAFRPSLSPLETIDKARITPMPAVRNVYRDVVINLVGTAPSFNPAPLFNVVRWDFSGNYGRAIHHYVRGTFPVAAMGSDQQFTPEYQGYNQGLLNLVADQPQLLCDKNGNQYHHFAAVPKVGMRQLRRGSKRKARPVI